MKFRARLVTALLMALVGVASSLVVAAAPASAAPCTTSDPLWGGTYYCGYGRRSYNFTDGTYQVFVIGTDYAVWTKWRKNGNYSKWVSLGGRIRASHDFDDFGILSCFGQPIVGVIGTNGLPYGNGRNSDGSWSGWSQAEAWECD